MEGDQWRSWLQNSLSELQNKQLLRTLRPLEPIKSGTKALIDYRELTAWLDDGPQTSEIGMPLGASERASSNKVLKLFSLNDYMGLANHPSVCEAAAAAVRKVGQGLRSSALVGGHTTYHAELEQELAELKCTEACLLYPTGFAANLGVVTALGSGADVAIFSDELNHASIIDGARLASKSGARVHVYRHNDLQHLDALLTACQQRRKLVITDSLFSMDGDFADLEGLAQLRRSHGFMLAVDEAHATLVCGPRGGGGAEMMGVEEEVDVHVGTLSKAFGVQGGFVCCTRGVRSWLLNRGRPLVYSTALPVPVVAAASEALRVSSREAWRRTHLWQLVNRLGTALGVPAQSPIIPVVLGRESATLQAGRALLRAGLHVPAIRPPTVAPGSCRLRISLSAEHTHADVDELVAAMRESGVIAQAHAYAQSIGHKATTTATLPHTQLPSRL